MTPSELKEFLHRHGLYDHEFAKMVGVTPMAVHHWLSGHRSMSLTLVRLVKLFDRRPELMKEFLECVS